MSFHQIYSGPGGRDFPNGSEYSTVISGMRMTWFDPSTGTAAFESSLGYFHIPRLTARISGDPLPGYYSSPFSNAAGGTSYYNVAKNSHVDRINFQYTAIQNDGGGTGGNGVQLNEISGRTIFDLIGNQDTLHISLGDTDSINGNRIDLRKFSAERYEVFGGEASDVVFGGTSNSIVHLRGGADKYTGVSDKGALSSGQVAPVEYVYGDSGDDRLHGGRWKDYLFGGADNDVLIGGKGGDYLDGGEGDRDTVRFSKSWTEGRKNFSMDGQDVIARVDGADRIRNVEFAKFSDKTMPLVNWKFVIGRWDDGNAQVELYQNDIQIRSIPAYFDDATPIPNGSYGAMVRFKPSSTPGIIADGKNWRIELSDQEDGTTTVLGDGVSPKRTAIQIHKGGSTQSSDGCIVLPGSDLRQLLFPLTEALADAGPVDTLGGKKTYQLIFPLSVELYGNVAQPTLERAGGKVKKVEAGDAGSVRFALDDGANDSITKRVYLEYDLKSAGAKAAKIATSIRKGKGVESVEFDGDRLKVELKESHDSFKFNFQSKTVGRADFTLVDADFMRWKNGDWVRQSQEKWQMKKLMDFSALDFGVQIYESPDELSI
ncbi:hypothetical protein [Tropicimonas sediminicola]|uniref:Hemolysin-type calcium-binding repeat-containing protein n=1 Tax=Tropicimonas sediminicola TaxID=1031541 RepID=A0A239M3E1_9RHOB|nr:hypothetical protein [Tropicimonas sediminicola]SNT36643.1 hypothetical protein SAMN05421757_11230 [Tropicimonas sediminicola]